MVCDQLKNARTHAHRTHVLEVFSHAHAHVRPHIARVRARTHLRNSYLGIYVLESCKQERGSEEFFTSSKARATNFFACNKNKKVLMICKPFKTPSLSLRILQQLHIMPSFKYKRHTKSEYYRQAGTLCVEMGFIQT